VCVFVSKQQQRNEKRGPLRPLSANSIRFQSGFSQLTSKKLVVVLLLKLIIILFVLP